MLPAASGPSDDLHGARGRTALLLLVCLAASAGPAAVVAVALHSAAPVVRGTLPPRASDAEVASSGPLEFAAVLTVGAAANVAVEYSSSWEHSVARCTNTTAGVGVYLVNPPATDTTAGGGPRGG